MILKNIFNILNNQLIDLEIKKDQISAIGSDLCGEIEIDYTDAIIFPGLINSHDHLDFNLFPRLGSKKYNNYTEWGPAIQSKYAIDIDRVIQIPQRLRYEWGIIKNLLGGVTSVVNHGTKSKESGSPIKIIDQFQHLHSVHFEKYWRLRVNNPLNREQFSVIHIGEGIDRKAHEEINKLIRYNLLNKNLVGVHGVSMDIKQAKCFVALVWCPQSNTWMFGKTADVEKLKEVVPIVFGTDSTLTSDWNIWNHLRDARETKKLTDIELIQSLTYNAANLWNLNTGAIEIGKIADLVIAKKRSTDPLDSFFKTNPEDILMVISNGKIVLLDDKVLPNIPNEIIQYSGLKPITLYDTIKYIPEKLSLTIEALQKYSYISLPCKVLENAISY